MRTAEGPGRDCLRLLVWYPLRWLLLALPPSLALASLQHMGNLHFTLASKKRQLLSENLQQIGIPFCNHEQIIRSYFQTHYLDQLFILVFPKLNRRNIAKFVTFRGLANLDAARKKGKGVILVHGHLGPVHLPLVALAHLGYPMKQIGNPSNQGLSWIGRHVAFKQRMRYEQRIPAEIISAGSFLRPVFTALRENKVVMTTGDGSGTELIFGKQHLFSFLGKSVLLPLGPAILARKTGAVLLPLFIEPGTNTSFNVIIEEEIIAHSQGEQGIIESSEQFIRRLEQYIRLNPGYMHFLDRFTPGQMVHV
ncbi:MAG: hypothetical protein BWK76_09300 [Desulfobulbaceae bacterium A2]|nr:MAG: hypothetical protein BWK76_09300 [Desulfobulbaceae bacterium A2]